MVCTQSKLAKSFGQNDFLAYTVPHLTADLGISRLALSTSYSLGTICAGLIQPLLGRLVDRHGARVCITVAHVLFALALQLFAALSSTGHLTLVLIELSFAFFLLRSIAQGILEIAPSQCLQQWFVRYRGRAVAVVMVTVQLGYGVFSPIVSSLVDTLGWRRSQQFGSCLNFVMALIAALLLRRNPEACGLAPDGSKTSSAQADETQPQPPSTPDGAQDGKQFEKTLHPLPGGLILFYSFTFFYAWNFGGMDFHIVTIMAEAGGAHMNVALLYILPGRFAASIMTVVIGCIADRCSSGVLLLALSLAAANQCTVAFMASGLVGMSPAMALACGVMRGCTNAVWETLLRGGLIFARLGVHQSRIGEVLGRNAVGTLVGTGIGPLFFGWWRDLFGSFQLGVLLATVPMLFVSVLLASRAHCCSAHSSSYGTLEELQPGIPKTDSNVFGLPSEAAADELEEHANSVTRS